MPVDVEKLRSLSPGLEKFLQYESELEGRIRMEDEDRRREYDEKKRALEKKARKKRIKRMRQMQSQ
jgi:hypothetical protein